MFIRNKNDIAPIESPHGETIRELIGNYTGGSNIYSLAYTEISPHCSSLAHSHPYTEESYYILQGKGKIIINKERKIVKEGDAIVIPKNAIHQIQNITDNVLLLLVICVPAWTPNCSIFLNKI